MISVSNLKIPFFTSSTNELDNEVCENIAVAINKAINNLKFFIVLFCFD